MRPTILRTFLRRRRDAATLARIEREISRKRKRTRRARAGERKEKEKAKKTKDSVLDSLRSDYREISFYDTVSHTSRRLTGGHLNATSSLSIIGPHLKQLIELALLAVGG